MGVMGMMAVSALVAVDNVLVAMLVFGLLADEAEEAVDEQTQENPDGIEHGGGFQHIEDGSPQFRERSSIVDDGIDVQAYGYHKADEQGNAFLADAAGGEVEVRHL